MRPMKDSGIEWIGEVPSDWRVAPLWALASARAGGTPKSSEPSYWDDDGLPWISIGDMSSVRKVQATSKAVSKTGLDSKNIPVGRQGDVLFAMYASVGAVAMLDIKACWNQAILGLRTKPHLVKNWYLYYLLKGLGDTWDLLSNANTQANLNQHSTMHLRVALPPIDQQEEMIHYLDQETSKIDLLISKKEQLIEKLLERRQALITQVVTKGLDPDIPMKDSGVEKVGQIPSTWTVIKLGSVCTLRNGHPFDSNDFQPDGDIPLVRIRDIKNQAFSTFLSKESKIPKDAQLKHGDVIIGMDGDFNSVFWTKGDAALNQRLCYLRFTDLRMSKFVSYAIEAPLRRINEITYSTTVKHLASGQVSRLPMAIPNQSELGEIVKHLDDETKHIDKLVEASKSAIGLLKERRQALITQVVTGKLDVRG